MNCIVSAGISFEPNFDSIAQAPHDRTQSSEYQNHRAFSVASLGIEVRHRARAARDYSLICSGACSGKSSLRLAKPRDQEEKSVRTSRARQRAASVRLRLGLTVGLSSREEPEVRKSLTVATCFVNVPLASRPAHSQDLPSGFTFM